MRENVLGFPAGKIELGPRRQKVETGLRELGAALAEVAGRRQAVTGAIPHAAAPAARPATDPGPGPLTIPNAALEPAGDLAAEDIILHCRERIADYKIPASIEFRESLPRASTGKVLRAQL